MKLRKRLAILADVIAEEAERNDSFRLRLENVLHLQSTAEIIADTDSARKGGRRTAAVLDPIDIVRKGEEELRSRLSALTLEQLKDVVAQYGMDPGKLVMKWKSADRVVDRIVELAVARSKKGDAFRGD